MDIDTLFAGFDGAFAEHTFRACRSDYRVFARWSAVNDVSPSDPSAAELAAFVDAMAVVKASATVRLGGWLSGHSFRVGAALDMLEDGVGMEKIMLRGGWKSESTVMRYLRAWEPV